MSGTQEVGTDVQVPDGEKLTTWQPWDYLHWKPSGWKDVGVGMFRDDLEGLRPLVKNLGGLSLYFLGDSCHREFYFAFVRIVWNLTRHGNEPPPFQLTPSTQNLVGHCDQVRSMQADLLTGRVLLIRLACSPNMPSRRTG